MSCANFSKCAVANTLKGIINIIKIIKVGKRTNLKLRQITASEMVLFSDYCMSRLRKLTIRTIAACSDSSDSSDIMCLAPEDAGGSLHAAAVTIHSDSSDCLETTVVAATLNFSKREPKLM